MNDDKNQSIQLDDIMHIIEVLERRIIRLESSLDVHRKACDTMSDNVFSMYKRIHALESYRAKKENELNKRFDEINFDFNHVFHLMHAGGDFCGNCARCIPCPGKDTSACNDCALFPF